MKGMLKKTQPFDLGKAIEKVMTEVDRLLDEFRKEQEKEVARYIEEMRKGGAR